MLFQPEGTSPLGEKVMVYHPPHRDPRVVYLAARILRREATLDVFQAEVRRLEGRRFGKAHERYRDTRLKQVGWAHCFEFAVMLKALNLGLPTESRLFQMLKQVTPNKHEEFKANFEGSDFWVIWWSRYEPTHAPLPIIVPRTPYAASSRVKLLLYGCRHLINRRICSFVRDKNPGPFKWRDALSMQVHDLRVR